LDLKDRERNLTRSLLLGISAVIALMIANIFVTQESSRDQRDATARVIHTLDLLGHLDAIVALIAEADAAQSGFVLTNDDDYLEPYAAATRRIDDRIDVLRSLVVDNPPQSARVERLRRLIQDRRKQMDRVMTVSREAGLMAARQALIQDLYRETRRAIGEQIAILKGAENELLANRLAISDATYRQARRLNFVAGALGLLALGAFVFLVDKNLRAREAASAEIFRQRETLRVTLTSIGDGVITTDTLGRVVFLNREAEALTGWTTDEAEGKPLEAVFRIVNEETRQPVETPVARALREGGGPGVSNQSVIVGRGGEERPIDASAAPILVPGGKVAGVVLIFRDVAEERAATNQLRELAAKLSDANRRKNEFLAMLAHEIRNPLSAIRNSVAVLKHTGGAPEASAAAQGAIDRQMEHLVRLVEDLLDVSRISRGKLALRRSRIDLREALASAVEACRPILENGGQEFEVAIPELPLPVDGDATRLTQAIGNLLSNAGKFTPPGGKIRLSAGLEGSEVVVRVRDDGIGIAASDIPGLFDMFSQIDTGLERTQGGLGIGLSLVKQLIEMHDGRVEAHSEGPGRGSEFVVVLPAALEAAAVPGPSSLALPGVEESGIAAAPAFAQPTGAPSGCRILVVDDNVDSAESLAMLLRLHGHRTEVAHDGIEAVEVALRTTPEVVLLDIGLPRLNGYEAARRIRLSPRGQRTRLIALTGWGQEEDRRLASEAGFDDHLVKPVDHERLLALLATGPRGPEGSA
jgi:PAS domain S-box-containing protein